MSTPAYLASSIASIISAASQLVARPRVKYWLSASCRRLSVAEVCFWPVFHYCVAAADRRFDFEALFTHTDAARRHLFTRRLPRDYRGAPRMIGRRVDRAVSDFAFRYNDDMGMRMGHCLLDAGIRRTT